MKKPKKSGKRVVRWHWSRHLSQFYKEVAFQFYSEIVDEDTELRKNLLEAVFVNLVKQYYINKFLLFWETENKEPSIQAFQEFMSSVFSASGKQSFKILDNLSEYYVITFEYQAGELIYDDIHACAIFDAIWKDIDLILEFVRLHLGSMSKEQINLFRQYLMEDAESYPNSDEVKQRIKKIFLSFETAELIEQIREDITEQINLSATDSTGAITALEVFAGERLGKVFTGIVPYEDTRQTWRQPFTEQHGLKLWTAMYEQAPLPPKSQERIRRFLMTNFYELFLYLIPYEISGSKKLEQDINAGNALAQEFKSIMTDFLNSLNPKSILITKGGYGKASYMLTTENLSILYADELALREIYQRFSFNNPEIKTLFQKLYKWTKDMDIAIELENSLKTRKEKELKRYLYSYEEEEKQKDALPRKLLKKKQVDLTPEEAEVFLKIKEEIKEEIRG